MNTTTSLVSIPQQGMKPASVSRGTFSLKQGYEMKLENMTVSELMDRVNANLPVRVSIAAPHKTDHCYYVMFEHPEDRGQYGWLVPSRSGRARKFKTRDAAINLLRRSGYELPIEVA
jgi:hypothetical protein